MNKIKIIIVAISVVVLAIVSFFLLRFIQGLLFSAAQDLTRSGEAPIEETAEAGLWVAPTMPPIVYDDPVGLESVEAEDDQKAAALPDDADDDVESIPVEETAEQLANTQPDDFGQDQDIDDLSGE